MSNYTYQRSYRGPLKACIFDWAGTTLDFGCIAPAIVFQKVFEKAGCPITMEEARGPMGSHKKVHIREITMQPAVKERWEKALGRLPDEADIEKMYQEFIPLQLLCLSDYSQLIPGTLETMEALRKRNLKIGSTTGYSKEMMDILTVDAENQGFRPDCVVSASEVSVGRPYPYMLLQNLINLQVSPVEACVKIDDTTPGIEEGLNAGCWTIGLAVSGNDVGMDLDRWNSLEDKERRFYRERAYQKHLSSGAHYVVDTIKDILPCLDDIEHKLRLGIKP